MRRRYQKIIQDAKVRIAVAEVPGASLKKRIQKSDSEKSERRRAGMQMCVWCVVMEMVGGVEERV